MRKIVLALFLILFSSAAFAQNHEKIGFCNGSEIIGEVYSTELYVIMDQEKPYASGTEKNGDVFTCILNEVLEERLISMGERYLLQTSTCVADCYSSAKRSDY